jgi:hypothetical protein
LAPGKEVRPVGTFLAAPPKISDFGRGQSKWRSADYWKLANNYAAQESQERFDSASHKL